MPNNFRLTGAYYVCKAPIGNNANNGTTKDTPKLTVQAAATALGLASGVIVVGTGVYRENIAIGSAGSATFSIQADGVVLLDGNGGSLYISANSNNSLTLVNLRLKSYTFGKQNSTGTSSQIFYNGCYFDSCTNVSPNASQTFTNCTFKNCTFSASATVSFTGCKFFNCTFTTATGTFIQCYLDAASTPYTVVSATNNNNLFEGFWKVNTASVVTTGVIQNNLGKYFDLSLAGTGGTGTVGDPFYRGNTIDKLFALAPHKVAYPTMNVQSIASSPLFNNVSLEDFTVQYASPLLARNSIYSLTIANAKYALGFYPNVTPELLQVNGAIISGLSGTSDLTVISGSGYIQTAPINYGGANITELGTLGYIGALTYDKSVAPPDARNQNVPDAQVYSASVAGAAPDRLVIEMRISTKASVHFVSRQGTSSIGSAVINMSNTTGILVGDEISGDGIPIGSTVLSIIPSTSITISANSTKAITNYFAFTAISDWDNAGIVSSGIMMKFGIEAKPYYDNLGITSGEPAWDFTTLNPVGATYLQFKVTLTNSYL